MVVRQSHRIQSCAQLRAHSHVNISSILLVGAEHEAVLAPVRYAGWKGGAIRTHGRPEAASLLSVTGSSRRRVHVALSAIIALTPGAAVVQALHHLIPSGIFYIPVRVVAASQSRPVVRA